MMNEPATKYISRAALDTRARNILSKYDSKLINGKPQAIPIEEIAENYFGLKIEYICLRKFGVVLGTTVFRDCKVPFYDKMAGYNLIDAKRGTMFLDESLLECENDGRLRFTCAHELSHWILHPYIFTGNLNAAAMLSSDIRQTGYESVEWQADYFASALLMPKPQVKSAFYELRNKASDITAELAELFDISKQAMSIFIKEHKLE